jgi:hypothetical protein
LSCNVVMFVLDESDASSFLDWLSYYLDWDDDDNNTRSSGKN